MTTGADAYDAGMEQQRAALDSRPWTLEELAKELEGARVMVREADFRRQHLQGRVDALELRYFRVQLQGGPER